MRPNASVSLTHRAVTSPPGSSRRTITTTPRCGGCRTWSRCPATASRRRSTATADFRRHPSPKTPRRRWRWSRSSPSSRTFRRNPSWRSFPGTGPRGPSIGVPWRRTSASRSISPPTSGTSPSGSQSWAWRPANVPPRPKRSPGCATCFGTPSKRARSGSPATSSIMTARVGPSPAFWPTTPSSTRCWACWRNSRERPWRSSWACSCG